MRTRLLTLMITAFALVLPASAAASPLYEPNDGIHQAFGPLEAGVDYKGSTDSENDVDWYAFYTSGPGVIKVQIKRAVADVNCPWTIAYLRDADGGKLNFAESTGSEEEVTYTAPGPGAYYLEVYSYDGLFLCAGGDYRLNVMGPLTAGPRPGPAELTPNNNPDLATAFGPLLGDKLYGGSIDTRSEQDWFYLYTVGGGSLDIAVTNINDRRCCGHIVAELYDSSGKEINGVGIDSDSIGHLRYTAPGAAKFALKIWSTTDSPPDNYQFRIDPANLLTTVPPPSVPPTPSVLAARQVKKGVSVACKRTRESLKKFFASFKKARRKAATAKRKSRSASRAKARRNWRKAQRKWATVTKKRKKALGNAKKRMNAACR